MGENGRIPEENTVFLELSPINTEIFKILLKNY